MDLRKDHRLEVGVDEISRYLEFFAEDVELAVTAYEPEQYNLPVRDIVESRQLGIGRQGYGLIACLLDELHGRFAFQTTVPVMLVVEPLKIFALPFESCIARKPLPAEEFPVVGVIEVLNDAISPRLPNGNEHRSHPIEQTHSNDQAK